IAAGPEGGVDIDPAGVRCEERDRLAAEHGNVTRRGLCHAPAPANGRKDRKLDATGPIAPRIPMFCTAFAVERPPCHAVVSLAQPARQTLASNVLGCHGISSVKLRLFTT